MSETTTSEGTEAPVAVGRPQRADARRNYDALLNEAKAAFATNIDAPLEDIAQHAGVGIGTLYRHFPNRGVLVEAVYRREVERLIGSADELLAELPPYEALATWLRRFVAHAAAKRGMATALKAIASTSPELFEVARERMAHAIGILLDAAAAAGAIRADVRPQDVIRAVSGICLATDQSDWQEQSDRLVSLLLDGLRYGAPNRTDPD